MPPAGRGPAEGDRTALVVAGTPVIRTGEQLVFVKVVAVAPAVVRRDGRIQAGAIPPAMPGWERSSSSPASWRGPG